MHLAHNTRKWSKLQLRGVAWDSYVQIPTFVAQKTRNDRLTISEPILPITRKMQVTHYLRVTKKEKQTWPTIATIYQTNNVLLRA